MDAAGRAVPLGGFGSAERAAHPEVDGPFSAAGAAAARALLRSCGTWPRGRCQAAAGATNSASMVMVTASATSTPPASRAAFQVRPKSLREIFVLAEKPAR